MLIYMIEPYIWIKSMSTLERRYENKNLYNIAGGIYYLITVVKQFLAFSDVGNAVNTIMNIIMTVYMFLTIIVLVKSSLYMRILNFVIFCCLAALTELPFMVLATYLFNMSMVQVVAFGIINSICTLCSKLTLALICKFLYFNNSSAYIRKLYKNREILPLTVVNFLFEFLAVFIYRDAKLYMNKSVIILFVVIQIMLICNVAYIVYVLVKKNTKISYFEDELNKSKQIAELTVELRQLKHDMSNHANVIQNLVQDKYYDELEQYVKSAFLEVNEAERVYTLPDHALSAVLNSLEKKAKERDINFRTMIVVNNFYIPSHDICSIVSNMVGNAIEATENLEKERRYIEMEMSCTEEGYNINCINPYDGNKNFFKTTKQDRKNHGLGIGIIKSMTEKNRGIMRITPHETCFEINCFIPVPVDVKKGGAGNSIEIPKKNEEYENSSVNMR